MTVASVIGDVVTFNTGSHSSKAKVLPSQFCPVPPGSSNSTST